MKQGFINGKLVASVLLLVIACTQQPSFAQQPAQNIAPRRHGNLAAAQELSRQAFDKLTAAQQANEFDMGGHAARAKELLRQANAEMKLAAQAANRK